MKELVYLIQAPPFWLKTLPLSLTFLSSFLVKNNIEVKTLDLNNELFKAGCFKPKEWLRLSRSFENNLFCSTESKCLSFLENIYKTIESAKFIGFSIFKRNFNFTLSLAERIKQKFPDKQIILGGPEAFFLKDNKKYSFISHFVIGEGETPLLSIVKGSLRKFYSFEEIDNLDTLPLYDFNCLDIKKYSGILPLLSSRGCPYQCNFCSERLLSKKFRYHSPEYVLDQIKSLQNKYKTNYFVFCDSLINYKRQWLDRFCALLIKSNLKINWEAQLRIEKDFPLELAKLLKQSGCYNLFIGLESASDKILKLMNKGFTAKNALEMFKVLKKGNLHFEVSLIFGYPGENDKDFNETVYFILQNKNIIPKIAQANPFTDYLSDFSSRDIDSREATKKLKKFTNILQSEKIKYTRSFINNLIYS